MPRGLETKLHDSLERLPENIYFYYCCEKLVKTCNSKKSYDLYVKLHMKKCEACFKRGKPMLARTEIRDRKYGNIDSSNPVFKLERVSQK
jgi:hypothetical protein